MNKIFILIISIIILFILAGLFFISAIRENNQLAAVQSSLFGQKSNLNYQLKKRGVEISAAQGFKITRRDTQSITANKEAEIIKIDFFENLSRDETEKYIAGQLALFNGLFEPQLPPYPEFLTKETGCDEKFKPIERNSHYGNYYLVYAGKRFGYGICTEDLIEYNASLGFFYCPQRDTLFKLEYFIPKDNDFNELIVLFESFVCL